jgi:hypothetical protein
MEKFIYILDFRLDFIEGRRKSSGEQILGYVTAAKESRVISFYWRLMMDGIMQKMYGNLKNWRFARIAILILE